MRGRGPKPSRKLLLPSSSLVQDDRRREVYHPCYKAYYISHALTSFLFFMCL
nr:MAG TPA: hypothetical protein [Caudoviricetes sp.]